ncbi:MAG: type II toxin-antitoxin system Phd/YefM family antitoxin [Pseudomonadota bacterium]
MTQSPEIMDYASVSLEEASPPHTVGFSDARRALPALIKQVADTGVRAVITRYDKPAVAVVPLADLRKLEAWDLERAQHLSFNNDVDHKSLVNFMEAVNDSESDTEEQAEDTSTAALDNVLASMLAVPEVQERFQEIAASTIREVACQSVTSAAEVKFTAENLGAQLQQNMLLALRPRKAG